MLLGLPFGNPLAVAGNAGGKPALLGAVGPLAPELWFEKSYAVDRPTLPGR